MLNISENSVGDMIDLDQMAGSQYNKLPGANRMLAWWLLALLGITLVIFFLPWTQNIQMKGQVTTLLPEQRPQNVNSTIAGRIEKWYVREGDLVDKGDTIVFLSEIKAEYFDPLLIERTQNQIDAKNGSLGGYGMKIDALERQISALKREYELKKAQLKNKIQQALLKQQSNEAEVGQAEADNDIAEYQLKRTDTLYQKGIKSLNDLESKRLKVQETRAKLVLAKNKLLESKNEYEIANLEYDAIDNEYSNKIAKAESDKFTTLSVYYDAEAELNKLQNQFENYSRRNDMYYVIAPQSGYITKAIKTGIGEIIKEGENIVTVVPYERELAVEMYVKPMDLPLINLGQEVRLVFDGWQAFMISGWSEFSFGTYSGEVVAMDNIPNEKQLYRILIKSGDPEKPFPNLLRVGAGVQGIALLKDVPVWFEIWRQLNGFPAEFYQNDISAKEEAFKAPVKAVAK